MLQLMVTVFPHRRLWLVLLRYHKDVPTSTIGIRLQGLVLRHIHIFILLESEDAMTRNSLPLDDGHPD